GGADALGDLLGELAVVGVARRQLDPAMRDADQRTREVFVGEADRAEVGARGGAVGAVQERAALVAGIERHGCPPMRGEAIRRGAWRPGKGTCRAAPPRRAGSRPCAPPWSRRA